jgi:hypothetical protein
MVSFTEKRFQLLNFACGRDFFYPCIFVCAITVCFAETVNLSNGGISESQLKMIDAVKSEVSKVASVSNSKCNNDLLQNYDKVAALAADAKQRKEYEQVMNQYNSTFQG